MIPRYIGKLNWLGMFALLTKNAWKSSIFRRINLFYIPTGIATTAASIF